MAIQFAADDIFKSCPCDNQIRLDISCEPSADSEMSSFISPQNQESYHNILLSVAVMIAPFGKIASWIPASNNNCLHGPGSSIQVITCYDVTAIDEHRGVRLSCDLGEYCCYLFTCHIYFVTCN